MKDTAAGKIHKLEVTGDTLTSLGIEGTVGLALAAGAARGGGDDAGYDGDG